VVIRDLYAWLGALYEQPDREFIPFLCRNHDPAFAKSQAEAYRSGAAAAVAMAQKILTQDARSRAGGEERALGEKL